MATAPRGMTITEAYRSFRENKFIVDRTYQRKLVWTLEEKKRLIDSILNLYPVPLILLVQTQDDKYEIIDGMQRLNAIFSFIENQFPTQSEKYFDVDEFPTAKDMAEHGKFEISNDENKLTRAECATVLDYQLAVTIFTVKESEQITDIFGRIIGLRR